jgi:hypothetical protein
MLIPRRRIRTREGQVDLLAMKLGLYAIAGGLVMLGLDWLMLR